MYQLYRAILITSGRRQIALVILSLAIAALAAAPLKFQKDIVNGLTDSTIKTDKLLELAGGMMAVVLLSLALKWLLGYFSNTLGEDMIRRLRKFILISAQDSQNGKIDRGTLATTIAAEAEEVGKFTGGSIADPLMQLGTLVSVIGFVTATQPRLGLIAVIVVVPQIFVLLFSQRQVNKFVAQRVLKLRGVTNRITHRNVAEVQAEANSEFDTIYHIRRGMFLWKLSSKFIISTCNSAGLVAVLLFGGFLVLEGKSDIGTVVAATMGLTRLQNPISELIAFYRQVSAMTVKYQLLVEVTGDPTQA
ncbi:ABC transporter transmembrane domain-containing protein [Chachezhania sediminis]|uniref:ABC transporter transmembrane domain-containing protein n=1 Tax=Chachezhania sediminis TaxID=2599291 RepID=UPI00131C9463|nr:ABC transporter transmembrane domain-containing protein [Chachezhania sediminis]